MGQEPTYDTLLEQLMRQHTFRSSASSVGRALATRLKAARVDLAILLALTIVATVPRVVLLGDIPPGLHGDEAIAGLEARNILDQGSIGPYSLQASGVPAGTFYWTAAVFALLGESIFTLRLSFALLGIGSVILTYLAFRVMFSRSIATIATLLLAVSAWHLHYSRVAFIPIGWPLMEMATLLFFFLGLRYQSRLWFALAGAALGAGIYTYQAFPMFAIGLGVAVVWLAVFHYRRELPRFTTLIATMLGVALLVGLPMASFAYDNTDVYFGRHRTYSVTKTPEYETADSFIERVDLFAARELDYVRSLITRPVPDGVDAAGVFPLVDRVTLGLLIVGGGIALWRLRSPPYAAIILLILVIGIGPALLFQGSYRRTLGLTPLLAGVAALPLALVWEEARKRGIWLLVPAAVVVAVIVGSVATINLSRYFGSYDDHQAVQKIYAADLIEASRFIRDLPDGTCVYFYSDLVRFDHPPRLFLAPDAQGEERSEKFGPQGFGLQADRSLNVTYVFMDFYLDQLEVVRQLYPGGRAFTTTDGGGRVAFSSYLLPKDETAMEEGPTTGPCAKPEDRDETRQLDFVAIQQALEEYRQANGSYPNTGAKIQGLCSRPEDIGCSLQAVLSPVPYDPLGSLGGYWYVSDGATYTLYAQRETERFEQCSEHPIFLQEVDSLLCAHGP